MWPPAKSAALTGSRPAPPAAQALPLKQRVEGAAGLSQARWAVEVPRLGVPCLVDPAWQRTQTLYLATPRLGQAAKTWRMRALHTPAPSKPAKPSCAPPPVPLSRAR